MLASWAQVLAPAFWSLFIVHHYNMQIKVTGVFKKLLHALGSEQYKTRTRTTILGNVVEREMQQILLHYRNRCSRRSRKVGQKGSDVLPFQSNYCKRFAILIVS